MMIFTHLFSFTYELENIIYRSGVVQRAKSKQTVLIFINLFCPCQEKIFQWKYKRLTFLVVDHLLCERVGPPLMQISRRFANCGEQFWKLVLY